jgi:SPP1 family predicted phage head-tail adaptor
MDSAKYNSGRLRERARLERRVREADDAGGNEVSWAVVASGIPIALRPLSSRERIYAASNQNATTHEIVMRYRRGMTTDHRLVLEPAGTRVFAITGYVDVEERHRWLDISAIEGAAP